MRTVSKLWVPAFAGTTTIPPLDSIPTRIYIPIVLLAEGRSREASLGWGRMRFPRPAGMPVPGDPGLHPEVTTDLLPGAG